MKRILDEYYATASGDHVTVHHVDAAGQAISIDLGLHFGRVTSDANNDILRILRECLEVLILIFLAMQASEL